jgi:ABC-2 type transport system ATP-binding protein
MGTTILLTTHYMDEAQFLADRVAVISSGRLVALGRPDDLRDDVSSTSTLSFRIPAGMSAVDLPRMQGRPELDGGTVVIHTADPVRDVHTLSGWALDRSVDLTALTLTRPTLEETYLRLTGEVDHDQ